MRAEVIAWAVLALLLIAAETLAPGAFLLWMGLAAAAVFLGVLLVPGIPVLAQVAAFADAHFVVAKSSTGQVTTSDVALLSAEERPAELARMMSGSSGSTAGLDHAVERDVGGVDDVTHGRTPHARVCQSTPARGA